MRWWVQEYAALTLESGSQGADLFARASTLRDAGRTRAAFRLFLELAKDGDPSSQVNLGYMYDHGLGTARNVRTARRWYRAASQNGDSCGSYNLAVSYLQARRYRMAVSWLRKAAKQGDQGAFVRLAELHLSGRGVVRSLGKAKVLLGKALDFDGLTPFEREEGQRMLNGLSHKKGPRGHSGSFRTQ